MTKISSYSYKNYVVEVDVRLGLNLQDLKKMVSILEDELDGQHDAYFSIESYSTGEMRFVAQKSV